MQQLHMNGAQQLIDHHETVNLAWELKASAELEILDRHHGAGMFMISCYSPCGPITPWPWLYRNAGFRAGAG